MNLATFDVLPIEIANHVCSYLRQSEVSRLSLARKSFYELIRPILYRHPDVTSFTSLTLFQRTITQATYMGKADFQWSTKDCLDQTRSLDLMIDPTTDSARNGTPPPAILISRMVQAIVRRCPNLEITIRFAHCHCRLTPISVLEKETFPRVTKLIIYVGKTEPDGINTLVPPQERVGKRPPCLPNAEFWRPFVNGECFPDCKKLEIRHHWATTPPTNASLDLVGAGPHNVGDAFYHYHSRDSGSGKTPHIGDTSGLKKLESILLECTPELNPPLLMQLLGNPNSVAANLRKLDLRYCDLDREIISKLLYHAPPNLKHLVLICGPRWGYTESHDHEPPHLCPLLRDFAKNLVHLEFAASTICRELFFDDLERECLRKSGITTGIGNQDAEIEGSEKLDTVLIRETVEACRRQKRTKYRNNRVKNAIAAAKAKSNSTSTPSSLFGAGANINNAAAKAQREIEFTLDDEEESRRRLIEGSRTRWFRRYIAWRGLCYPSDTWAEIQLAADMEEKGIEWVVANERLRLGSVHSNGKLASDISINQALEEKFDFEPRAFSVQSGRSLTDEVDEQENWQ